MSKNFKRYLIRANNLFLVLLLFFSIATIILFIQKKYLFCLLSFIFIPMISWYYYLLKRSINEFTDD